MTANRTRWPLALALCSGYFLVLLDVTVVNVALPQIDGELSAGSAGLAWVVDAYSVPLAGLLLASGAIGDLVGHRKVVLIGFFGFGVASAACALAPSIAVLIAARAVQGVGAALMLPGTLALLVQDAPGEKARARLVGIWAAIGGAALPAGPVVGGLLVQAAGWRTVFFLSVPVIGLALLPLLRSPRRRTTSRSRGTVDWIGAVLLAVGVSCAVTAIIGAPSGMPAVFLGMGAVVALSGFLVVEHHTKHPLLPVPSSARGPLGLACLVAGIMNLCTLGTLFLLTQVFQSALQLSPLAAGLLTLPAMVPLPFLGAPAGRLGAHLGVWRTSGLGLGLAAAGLLAMAVTVTGTDLMGLVISLLLWGCGLGFLTPAIVAAALRTTPELPGLASGASNTSRQTGGALGIALFATIAGSADGPDFLQHAVQLMLGSAALFAGIGALCLLGRRG
ncbi:MFS transporter [Arthrobacter sp. NPDC090010]|uniref:MFS transporter n=1 Tax=Arthrobacter sp. NPDC090010 TaxID=3363942 RepID=UPI00380EA8D1